uniref:5'-nucleotidase, cytosolic IB b n=1 Tax=Oryzias sinensis TaxID=183150 RepID=A0A8C7X9M7_9TELE
MSEIKPEGPAAADEQDWAAAKAFFDSLKTKVPRPPKPQFAVTIAVSSRTLFNMVAERKIYEEEGLEKYVAFQVEHEDEPLSPGPAFPFVKSGWGKLVPCAYNDPHGEAYPQAEQGGGNYQNKLHQGRASKQTRMGSKSVKELLEERFRAKLKFSQFLDEVTSNVLDPNCLQAFGKLQSPSGVFITNSDQLEEEVESWRLHDSMALQQNLLSELEVPEAKNATDWQQKKYLETDIDAVSWDAGPQDVKIKQEQLEIDETSVIPPPLQFSQGFKRKIPSPDFCCDIPRAPHRSASLPRGINMVSGESCLIRGGL